MRKNYKPLIIGILCALIVVMAVGFALLREQLTITGTSYIDSNWNIRITNIRVKNLTSAYASGDNASADVSGSTGCTTNNTPCDSTSANFNVSLQSPGDYIIYRVTITNSGNLDGVVESIDLSNESNSNTAIQVTKEGLAVGDTISHTSPNNTNTVDIKVMYNPNVETQPNNLNATITLTINYQQDLGQVSPLAVTYDYSIGDTITYKEATWRVIKNSPSSENYVTLMKETVLTNAELGEYAYASGYDTVQFDKTEPYSNDYATSNVKAAIEAYATTKGMMNDLAEVGNYKIRLITKDELESNFGFEEQVIGTGTGIKNTELTPTWIYTNFGENQNNVYAYWTMTPYPDNASCVWGVGSGGDLYNGGVGDNIYGARPVINLLKSNIPTQS